MPRGLLEFLSKLEPSSFCGWKGERLCSVMRPSSFVTVATAESGRGGRGAESFGGYPKDSGWRPCDWTVPVFHRIGGRTFDSKDPLKVGRREVGRGRGGGGRRSRMRTAFKAQLTSTYSRSLLRSWRIIAALGRSRWPTKTVQLGYGEGWS